MPKIKQVLPTEVLASSTQKQTKTGKIIDDRHQEKRDTKTLPILENSSSQQSFRGKRHYFQQFPGTKRFVDSFLRKRRAEERIEAELVQISIMTSLPPNVPEFSDSTSVAYQNRSTARPKSAGISSRKFDVHHGVNMNDFSREDKKYYSERIFEEGLLDTTRIISSPDKLFDEGKARRVKKRPLTASFTKLDVGVIREEVFPEWITMRETILSKIVELVGRAMSSGPDREVINSYRQEFLSFTTILQHSTLKVVEFYMKNRELYHERMKRATHSEREDESFQASILQWQDWEAYVEEIPTSLNWLEENPFRLWCGIHFSYNPLLSCYDLYNELAVIMNEGLHQAIRSTNSNLFNIRSSLQISNPALVHDLAQQIARIHQIDINQNISSQIPVYIPEVISAMAKELRYDAVFHERIMAANNILREIHVCNKDKIQAMQQEWKIQNHRKLQEQMVSIDITRYNRLAFLVYGNQRLEELEEKSQLIRSKTQLFNTRNYFHLWQRCKYYEATVRYMSKRRLLRIFHWTLGGFRASKLQKYRLISLKERSTKTKLHVLWDRWQANLHWWKRFDSIYDRCNRDRLQYSLDKWQIYLDTKQKQRIEYLLPVLRAEYEKESVQLPYNDNQAGQPDLQMTANSVLNWVASKAAQLLLSTSAVPQQLGYAKDASMYGLSSRSPYHKPHKRMDDDELESSSTIKFGDNAIDDDDFEVSTLDTLKRRKLREMEGLVAENAARSFLCQQHSFRAWRKAYTRRILVHRMCFIMKDHRVWAAWQQWRAVLRECRFESKVQKRTRELLSELYDGEVPVASIESRGSPGSFSLVSPSTSIIDEELIAENVKEDDHSDNGSLFGELSRKNAVLGNERTCSVDEDAQRLIGSTTKNIAQVPPPIAHTLRDVPILYRRKVRFNETEVENSFNDEVLDGQQEGESIHEPDNTKSTSVVQLVKIDEPLNQEIDASIHEPDNTKSTSVVQLVEIDEPLNQEIDASIHEPDNTKSASVVQLVEIDEPLNQEIDESVESIPTSED